MIDLATQYLGLSLKSPLVASASPLCESVDQIRRLEECGVAVVVLPHRATRVFVPEKAPVYGNPGLALSATRRRTPFNCSFEKQ
jgi:dihydroorotate dehydrogenase